MKKIITIFSVLAIVAVLLPGCRKQSDGLTLRPGVLQIGMEIGYPPMEYYAEDGVTPIGFDVDMGREIATRLGLTPEFIDVGWDGIFSGLDTNRYDVIISSVTITSARQAVHNFSNPYIANTIAMVLHKDTNLAARQPMDLAGLDVAFQSGTTSDFYMERLRDDYGLNFTARRYDKVMNCFDELRLGRVDVIITDLLVAFDYVAPANAPFQIVWLSDEADLFGICLKKGNDALTDEINRVLEEMFEDGTMQRIASDIFGMIGPDMVNQARSVW